MISYKYLLNLFSARMCIVGTALGPMHHYYYLYLDKFIPKATFLTAMQKIFFDQLFASPGTIILFFLGIGYLEGKNTYKVGSELREKFVYVYLVSIQIKYNTL